MRWFNLAMPVVYVAVGVILLTTESANATIQRLRAPFAWLPIGYGAFRAWRAYRGPTDRKSE
jgi:hypothetical protein